MPPSPERAEDLAGLPRDLLLLAGDVRDDVVDDVERDHAGRAAGARDALHRRHEDALDAEAVEERLQRDDQAHRRAVRERRDEALPAAASALDVDRSGVAQVHARHQDRHVGLVAERRGGADHRRAPRSAARARARRRSTAEKTMSMPARSSPSPFSTGRASTSAGGSSWHHQRRAPVFGVAERLGVRLAGRALRGGERDDLEPRMPASATRNCWPAMPVAPTTATRFLISSISFPGAGSCRLPKRKRPATTRGWSRARGSEDVVEGLRELPGAHHRSCWASRGSGPQPGLVAGALGPADHAVRLPMPPGCVKFCAHRPSRVAKP